MGGMLASLTGTQNNFEAGAAPIAKQDFGAGLAQSAGQFNGAFDQQTALAQQLGAQAQGFGPNPAQLQLRTATDNNIKQQAGMLGSQRGLSPALAQRLAAQGAAATNQQSAGQAAQMGAQQQLNAQGQLAGVLAQQSQGSLGMNSNLQNAAAQQNNAIVGNASSINSANAATAMGNQKNSAGLLGGALGGIGSALGFAQGGQVPVQHLSAGGALSSIGKMLGGGSGGDSNPYASAFSSFGKGLHDMFSKPATPGSEEDYAQYSGSGFSPEQMSTEHSRMDAASEGGLPMDQMSQPQVDTSGLQAGGPGMYALVSGDPFAGIGPNYQVGKPNPDLMPFASGGSPMDRLRMAYGGDPQGQVQGQAKVQGNSLQNDKVPAMLSPQEIVLPRSITMSPNAPEMAAQFVRNEMSKKNYAEGGFVDKLKSIMAPDFQKAEKQKQNQQLPPPIYKADGGEIPQGLSADAPAQGPQAPNMGFDPNQFISDPSNTAAARAFQAYKGRVQIGDPFASDESATDTALQSVDAEKNFNLQRQQSQMMSQQQAHDEAVARNSKLASVGAPLMPVPNAPAMNPMMQEQGMDAGTNPSPGVNSMGNKQPQDPFEQANNGMLNSYMKAANEQKAGINMGAQAQANLGQADAKIAHEQIAREQQLTNDYQVQNKQLMGEYDAAMKDYQNGHINPNHYAESLGSVGKVKTAIGLILGGMGGGLLGQENPALKFLNSQIDRDMDAQKAELGKKFNLLGANVHKLGNLRDATEMTRVMMMGIQANQFREAAANAQGPVAKATAMQEAGKIDERIAPIMSQIAMRQTLLKSNSMNGDPSRKIQLLSQSGLMPKEDKEAADKELAKANELGAVKRDLQDAVKHIHSQTMNGAFSPADTQSAKMALAGRIVKLTEGRFNQEAAMNIVDAFFPRTLESNETTRNKIMRGQKTIDAMIQSPVLRRYNIAVPNASTFNFDVGAPVGK